MLTEHDARTGVELAIVVHSATFLDANERDDVYCVVRVLDQERRSASAPAPRLLLNSRLILPLIGVNVCNELVVQLWSERGRRKGSMLGQRILSIADALVLSRRSQCWLVLLPPREGTNDSEAVAELALTIEPPIGSTIFLDGAVDLKVKKNT